MWTWGQSRWGIDTAWGPAPVVVTKGISVMPVPPDLNSIHNPATGTIAPAAWGDGVRDWTEFLVDPPACSIFESTAQSVADNTNTALTSNEENFDNDAMHSTVSNTSRITATTAGRYLLLGTVVFAANATGVRQVTFRVDGTTTLVPNVQVQAVTSGGSSTALTLMGFVTLTAGQYVELMARHTAGAALNCTMSEFGATFITR